MPAVPIPIPYIVSKNGVGDSIFHTLLLWVLIFLVIGILSIIWAFLKGDIQVPSFRITPKKTIAAFLVIAAGIASVLISPIFLFFLCAAVLGWLIRDEIRSLKPDKGTAGNERDVPFTPWFRPGTGEGPVTDAEFHVRPGPDTAAKNQLRPAHATGEPVSAVQRDAEEKRALYEEQKKRDQQLFRTRERAQLLYIHGLYTSDFNTYLLEAEAFRKEFGKNVQCDVCGRWEERLSVFRHQTYCPRCLPAGSRPEPERGVVAGRHGALIDFIRK